MAKNNNPFQGDDVDPFSAARDPVSGDTDYKGPSEETIDRLEKTYGSKKMSFKEAFANARKGGGKTFEWNGKKYSTELAKPKTKSAAKPAAKVTDTGDEGTRLMKRYGVSTKDGVKGYDDKKDPRFANSMTYGRQAELAQARKARESGMKAGGAVKSSAKKYSKDGCCVKGKTKGRMV